MNMRDGETGDLQWESGDMSQNIFNEQIDAHIPRSILSCRMVAREINFTSSIQMKDFRLEQRVLFCGSCIEEWKFVFGFVIPGSTNTWQQNIEAAEKMLPAEKLTGNVVIETSFFDGLIFIARSRVRIFYD
jgi:retinal rod rhodopsin-sensitive cGMP 3',5'-cyclic phosphodiesterase subunit delta